MTDESFVYRTEVNERANVARNSKNRALKGGKCTLPSDNMSHWAKKRENGDVIVMAPNRPILYDDFKELSEEMQKEYLQELIDNYGGTTERIAKMWEISESKVKFHRQTLGVKSYLIAVDDTDVQIMEAEKWGAFLAKGNYLKEPMKYEEFRKLTKNEQRSFLTFCNKVLDGSPTEIANMLGINNVYCRNIMKKLEIQMHDRAYRYSHKTWEEWLEKNSFEPNQVPDTEEPISSKVEEPKEEPIKESEFEEWTPNFKIDPDENKIKVQEIADYINSTTVRRASVPYLNIIMTVESQDQIVEILKTLPKAKSGTITFTFGEESEKIDA